MGNVDVKVGTVLENGDTVFHVTDTEYWVVAPQSLWREGTWEEGLEYCGSLGYEMPDMHTLQLLYLNRTQIDAADSSGNLPTSGIWSSTEYAASCAWFLDCGIGSWFTILNNKYSNYWVIPFRRLQKDICAVDPIYTEVAPGICKVVGLKTAIGALNRIHCDLDNHTVDTGYPVERTPVLVGGKEIPLEDLLYPALLMGVRDRKSSKVVLYAAPLWSPDPEMPMRKVVSAACRNGDYMLVGPRHFCPIMHTQADAYHKLGYVDDRKWEQGFIDQWETYMDRHEALLVALAAGQPVDFKRNGGSGNKLFSEGLY